MEKNIGATDRVVRFILAALIVLLYFTGALQGAWGIVLLVAAAIFLITSITGFSPLYRLWGVKAKRKKKT